MKDGIMVKYFYLLEKSKAHGEESLIRSLKERKDSYENLSDKDKSYFEDIIELSFIIYRVRDYYNSISVEYEKDEYDEMREHLLNKYLFFKECEL